MAISALGARAGMSSTTSGTGATIALGTALGAVAANICSYEDFATAGIQNGQQVSYLILDSNGNWEVGTATYSSGGPSLTGRTPLHGTSGASAINLSGSNVQVYVTALDTDIGPTAVLHVDAAQSAFLTAIARGWGAFGNLQMLIQPQGRITLSSGTPVMTATVAAAGTVYYTPYQGCTVPIFDGTNWGHFTFAEISQLTTDATKSPASVTTNKNYDIFVWNDSGTIRATRGPAWSTDTSRGTGAGTTQLQMINGIQTNAVAITNGPGANRGTYVGTIRSNGTSTIDFTYGSAGAGGGQAKLGVWNMFNRVEIGTIVQDTNGAHTVGGGASITGNTLNSAEAMDNSSTNSIQVVIGLAEDGIDLTNQVTFSINASTSSDGYLAIGVNSTSSGTPYSRAGMSSGVAGNVFPSVSVRLDAPTLLGWNTYTALSGSDNNPQVAIVVSSFSLTGHVRM